MEEKTITEEKKLINLSCPVCGSSEVRKVIEIEQVPILCNVIWESREKALAAKRGDICLSFCSSCGHVFNRAFDPNIMIYDVQYENSLHFSSRFQQYAGWLANRLINQYNLRGKTIIEIGSGKGEFLRTLCDLGGNVGTGFDPSYTPSKEEEHHAISFVQETFSERHAEYPVDLILSRHVLEHLYQPAEFVQMLRRAIGSRKHTLVFMEVPNLGYILRDTAIWDIIYEHFSYFGANSLGSLFSRNGFNVLNLSEAYEGQFLFIESIPRDVAKVSPNAPHALPVNALENQVATFSERGKNKIFRWGEKLNHLHQTGKRVVIWGAGSKGISFLNMVNVRQEVEHVIDINPRKHGKFVTGTGQQIVPPDFLQGYAPDTVIIMNPVYRSEIQNTLNQLGLKADILLA